MTTKRLPNADDGHSSALTNDGEVAVDDHHHADDVHRPVNVGVDDVLEGRQAGLQVEVDEAPRARVLEGILSYSTQGHGAKQDAEEPNTLDQQPVEQ